MRTKVRRKSMDFDHDRVRSVHFHSIVTGFQLCFNSPHTIDLSILVVIFSIADFTSRAPSSVDCCETAAPSHHTACSMQLDCTEERTVKIGEHTDSSFVYFGVTLLYWLMCWKERSRAYPTLRPCAVTRAFPAEWACVFARRLHSM